MRLLLLLIAYIICPLPNQAEDIAKDSTISEVVVTGTRHGTSKSSLAADVTVISEKKLNETFRSNILPTLTEQVPGLFVTSRGLMGYGVNTGAGNISIRGVGGGAQLMVLIDGQPQYAGLMGHPIPDAYQTSIAQRVEVLRGPSCVLYGSNAMAGVVNIITGHENLTGHHTRFRLGAGSYGTLQAEAIYRTKVKRFYATASGTFQRTKGHRPNSSFEQGGGFLKIGYTISPYWKVFADAQATHFNTENPGPTNSPLVDNDSRITRGLASATLLNKYKCTNGSLRGYYDWGHHHINDGYTTGTSPKDYRYLHNDHIAGISLFQSTILFKGNRTTIGADWQHFGGKAWNRYLQKGETLLVDTTQNEIGTYLDLQQTLTPWFTLNAGLRADWHSHTRIEWIPSFGLVLHPQSQSSLRLTISKGFRNPTIRELYMFRSANPQLQPEKMMNYEMSYSTPIGMRGNIGANLFLIKGNNLIATIMKDGRPQHINTNSFTNHGFELNTEYRFNTHWSASGNFSYLHMQKKIVGAPQGKLYVAGHYSHKRFTLIAALQHISGLYTSIGENAQEENFTLLNATASMHIRPELTLWLKGENLLATRYQTYSGFPMPKATVMAGIEFSLHR